MRRNIDEINNQTTVTLSGRRQCLLAVNKEANKQTNRTGLQMQITLVHLLRTVLLDGNQMSTMAHTSTHREPVHSNGHRCTFQKKNDYRLAHCIQQINLA